MEIVPQISSMILIITNVIDVLLPVFSASRGVGNVVIVLAQTLSHSAQIAVVRVVILDLVIKLNIFYFI